VSSGSDKGVSLQTPLSSEPAPFSGSFAPQPGRSGGVPRSAWRRDPYPATISGVRGAESSPSPRSPGPRGPHPGPGPPQSRAGAAPPPVTDEVAVGPFGQGSRRVADARGGDSGLGNQAGGVGEWRGPGLESGAGDARRRWPAAQSQDPYSAHHDLQGLVSLLSPTPNFFITQRSVFEHLFA
jgi:hypothetical protein